MRVCPKRAGPDVWIPADISGSPGCRAAAGRSRRLARAPGGGAAVPTRAVFSEATPRELCNFSIFFARPSGSSFGVREIAIWSRIMILYETISRGLAVRCRPARDAGARRLRARPPCALALDLSDETRRSPRVLRVASPEAKYRDALSFVALRPWDDGTVRRSSA